MSLNTQCVFVMKATEGHLRHISLFGIKFQLKPPFSSVNREITESQNF